MSLTKGAAAPHAFARAAATVRPSSCSGLPSRVTSIRLHQKGAAAPVAALLKDYQTFLEKDLMPRATGEWRIGKKKFYKKFELETDAGVTADEVFADAKSESERVRGEMYVVARYLWSNYFPKAPLPPNDPAGRRETITRVIGAVDQEHGRPEELLVDARQRVAHAGGVGVAVGGIAGERAHDDGVEFGPDGGVEPRWRDDGRAAGEFPQIGGVARRAGPACGRRRGVHRRRCAGGQDPAPASQSQRLRRTVGTHRPR